MAVKVRPEINYYTTNEDLKFIMEKMIPWEEITKYNEGDFETYKMTLQTVGKLAGEKFQQRMTDNDRETSHLQEVNKIKWADGLEQSFNELKEQGLLCLPVHYEGAPCFPFVVNAAVVEILSRADPALMTKYGLLEGVAETIGRFASEELKRRYIPKAVAGEYTASMDLTEAEAGSDLGMISTRAKKVNDKYLIEGVKNFITICDSDIHLVLARDDDTFSQTKGTTKGLSMYLVPKTLPDGTPNKIVVTKTEDKLGIRGTATGVVEFNDAEGYLVGEKGNGMKQMLRLMYGARLGVAAQALGEAEAAYQEALEYAKVRKQFGTEIINHPLVSNMLIDMRLKLEASRALTYDVAVAVDLDRGLEKKVKEDASLQKEYERWRNKARVLTPLAKYAAAEYAIEIARKAIQVHGGVGFIREYLVEQFYRDSVVTAIYEGTSEIQLLMASADILRGLFEDVLQEVKDYLNNVEEKFKNYAERIKEAIKQFEQAKGKLQEEFMKTGKDTYIRFRAREFGEIVILWYVGYVFLKHAEKSTRKEEVLKLWLTKMEDELPPKVKAICSMDKTMMEKKELLIEGKN